MTNIEIAQIISNRIGTEPIPFDSVYSLCLQIYQELGGTENEFDDVYSILLHTLPLTNIINDNVTATNKTWSSSKISTDLVTKQGTLTAGANITIDSGNTISALLPAEDVQLPFMIYAYKKRPDVPVDDVPTEVPSSFIDENGDVIVDDNNGCYVVRMNDSYHNPDGIISGNYRYNKISVDKTILGYNYIIYRTTESTNQYLTGAAEGADDTLTTSPSVSLHRTMDSTMITPFINLLKSYDGKVICWQGQEGRVPSVVDVTVEPSVFNNNLYSRDELLQGNTIMHCSTQLKKGHYYKLTFSKFNQYGISGYTSWEQLYYNAQTRSGWTLCFDEIGNVIETITKNSEDIIELQSAIDNKQDTLTAGSNINISSNTISADGYIWDASTGGFAEKYKQDAGDGGQVLANMANALGAHAEGYNTTASGAYGAHAEGNVSVASGYVSHAEGNRTVSSGIASHTEGVHTTASGKGSHAEGAETNATGIQSHAEGVGSTAQGLNSHAEGEYTIAINLAEHAEGNYNISHTANDTYGNAGNTQHSVGIGSPSTHKNAFEIMQNGDMYVYGVGGYQGTDTKVQNASILTLQEAINSKADAYQTATTADIEALFA